MSTAGDLRWLCRLVDDSLSPYTEPHAFVSANKENEKKILISSSQVMRKIQLRIHEFDSASNKEDFEQHCSVHHCLPKIVTKMVNLLTVKSEFVQHVAVNALVLTSEFLSTTGNSWAEFIHLLCCSLETAFTRMLSCSFENNNLDSRDVDFMLQHELRNCDWSTVAGIVKALRVICKHLKEDYDGLVKVYYDSVNSCLLKIPWNLLDECWSCDNGSRKKSLSVNELHLNNLGDTDPGIRFLGTFLQLLCTLVDRNNFEETDCDSASKHPLFVTVVNFIPRLVKWCLPRKEDNAETCIIHYMKHKLLILMIRLSSLLCLDCSDYFSWLEILHNHFQELLLQPLTQFMSDQGDCLEGSPFLSSLSDGEAYGVPSSHLQRQAIFLLLDCSVNLINQRGSMKNQSDCSTLSSLFTNNPDTELDHLHRKKGLLELYKWIQNHLPNEVSINYEMHPEICINFMSSFLQLYIREDDLLFEVLLQLLSISSCLQQLSGRKDAAYQDVKRDFPFDLSDIFNPVYLFHLFLSEIHYDHQVLLDYLISKDTGISCAKYLLRCMHLICNSWKLFVEFPLSGEFLNQSSCKRRKLLGDGIQFVADRTFSSVDKNGSILLHIKNFKEDSEYDLKHRNIEQFKKAAECLLSLNNSIGNLHQKSLFPYNPEVLLRRKISRVMLPGKGI
ncbi:uncharacterized protein [Medicago truncatula]|uniref:uncharacterized protein isoform X2 n=1 Tax=Medicago truncatula TaxID=3880 RepID=UPI001967F19D|nr:uncharacterized protein LOC25501673 isoform X2 [Medicago truncatula]XP_039684733.1 uncharacterized protein LOC25501673 isoform X2 [Medicago truncatula]